MSSDDLVISARNLGKTYRLFGHPGDRLKQAMSFGLRTYHKDHTALKDVSFDVRRGEAVGIIGRNGSGKSTLLQLICGILKPTAGSVALKGRVAALLELGAGFNPEFTGRENVYFQGAMMGISRQEMDRRFDGIAEFAGIGDFIDQPVRTYSSGMYMRLGFAVSVNVEPLIMLVDEALAVGDEEFSVKCINRISEMRANGTSILFVSHSELQVREAATRCLLLNNGQSIFQGDVDESFRRYHDIAGVDNFKNDGGIISHGNSVKIIGFRMQSEEAGDLIQSGSSVCVQMDIECIKKEFDVDLEIRFWTTNGLLIATVDSNAIGQRIDLQEGPSKVDMKVNRLSLMPGIYRVAGGVRRKGEMLGWSRELCLVNVFRGDVISSHVGLLSLASSGFEVSH